MYTSYNISLVAGVAAVMNFTFSEGEVHVLRGAVTVRGQSLQAQASEESSLIFPPLPEGLWLLEVRADGHPIIYQHIEVLPSGVASAEGGQTLSVTVNEFSINIQGGVGASLGGNSGPDISYLKKIFAPLPHVNDSSAHVSEEDRKRWNNMVSTEVLGSEAGSQELTAHAIFFSAARVPIGSLRSLSIRCRNSHQDYLIGGSGVFLAIYERIGDGDEEQNWARLGVSLNAVAQQIGTQSTWQFDSLALHGRELRVVPLQNKGDNFLEDSQMVLGCLGFATNDGSKSDSIAFLPEYTMVYDAMQFAPLSHVDDMSMHLSPEEKQTIQNIVNNPDSSSGPIVEGGGYVKFVVLKSMKDLPEPAYRKPGVWYFVPEYSHM